MFPQPNAMPSTFGRTAAQEHVPEGRMAYVTWIQPEASWQMGAM